MFYNLERIEDPLDLMPLKLILGISKNGLHFIQANPNVKSFLYRVKFKDLRQFGSSKNAVYFNLSISKKNSTFHFKTRNGEEICHLIQTYITDVLNGRLNRRINDEDIKNDDLDTSTGFESDPQIKALKEELDGLEIKYQGLVEMVSEIEDERNQKIRELRDLTAFALREENDNFEEMDQIAKMRFGNQLRKIKLMIIAAKLNIIENDDVEGRFGLLGLVYGDVELDLDRVREAMKEKEFLIGNGLNEKKEMERKIGNYDEELEDMKQSLNEEISIIETNFQNQLKVTLI